MLTLSGVVLGLRSEQFVGKDNRPGEFHRLSVAGPDGSVVIVKVPGRLLQSMNGSVDLLRRFGQRVQIVCHPATFSDYGLIRGCVEAERIGLVDESTGEVIDGAAQVAQ